MLKEFKQFLITGNVVDMAVGFIFGAAFATVVKSLVANIIMPPIGLLMGGVDFSSLFIALDGKDYVSLAALDAAGAPAINVNTQKIRENSPKNTRKLWGKLNSFPKKYAKSV